MTLKKSTFITDTENYVYDLTSLAAYPDDYRTLSFLDTFSSAITLQEFMVARGWMDSINLKAGWTTGRLFM